MIVRFRADPEKVRVAIRPDGDSWLAFVSAQERGGKTWCAVDEDPVTAVDRALEAADGNLPGIDLDLQWAYDHPHKTNA